MSYLKNLDSQKLSEVEQVIYSYITKHAEQIPFMRVRDLAEATHTSSTSVFRFIKKAGFSSYPEFRLFFKQHLNESVSINNTENIYSVIQQHSAILQTKNFNPDLAYQVTKIAKKASMAHNIMLFGMGASGSVAEYAARKLANLGYNATSITDPTYPVLSRYLKKESNFTFVFSVSGETMEITEMLNVIHHMHNNFTCCITKNRTSPIANLCDYVIDYNTTQERTNIYYDLSSQLPAIFIIEIIIQSIRMSEHD